jgi:hypothetical protein
MENPSPERPLPLAEKTARIAEVFWLVTSFIATAYVVWLWATEPTPRWALGLFPCISWLWYVVRRTFRKRMATSANS